MDKDITVIITLFKTPIDKIKSLNQYKNYRVLIFEQSSNKNMKNRIKINTDIKFKYYFSKKNIGLPKASNFLLSKVKTKYSLFTQPDIKIDHNSIQNLKKALKSRKDSIFAGPIFLHKKKKKIKLKKKYEIKKKLNAACMLCNTEKLKNIGFFDEDFFLYWEDMLLMKKVNLNKLKMLKVPTAYAIHSGGQSSIDNYKVNFIRNLNFKYGEFVFDLKNKNFRILKLTRQILQNIFYFLFNFSFYRKEKFLNNLSNLLGIFKFIVYCFKK